MDDDEWISGQPYNLQHTGYFGAWNIETDYSHFTVKAETSDDFAATVGFAHQHNLRLVVKGTGHDWYVESPLHPGPLGLKRYWGLLLCAVRAPWACI